MHLTGVQRDGSRPFIRFLSHLAFHMCVGVGVGVVLPSSCLVKSNYSCWYVRLSGVHLNPLS